MYLLAVEATSQSSCDSCRAGRPENPSQCEAAEIVRNTMDPRANGRHALSEVDRYTRQDTSIRDE